MSSGDAQQKGFRWQMPVGDKSSSKLKILNSFTKKKEPFVVPNNSKTIKWYSCGPTVYDVSHLGHARCYITFDIIRRILADYFGFNIFYVMNITDIDDKIIKRARSNYLFDQYVTETLQNLQSNSTKYTPLAINEIKEALTSFVSKKNDETDPDKKEMIRKIIESSSQVVEELEKTGFSNAPECLQKLKDVLSDKLDSKLYHTVSDFEIFKVLTNKFEQEFHEDMLKLNVLPPSALTRVSEYIEEIGEFIKVLEGKGYAYRTNGSIYFDTLKFDNSSKHFYAKLVREAFGHKKSLEEGEGELSVNQDSKKSPSDFALWKKSKDGEPRWQTQDFELGRPGWHIECSVMASKILGENFDIHSGGNDLKFPHHDNEIAQAEAYYDSGKNWVNYFFHSGHLTISGCKMSKSLKNFVTIRQALNDYTSRQLRFAFLAHCWSETLDYSPNTMNTATSYEKTFREFFLNVSAALRGNASIGGKDSVVNLCDQFRKWSDDDLQLNQQFIYTIESVDSALCDNLDTRSALNHLSTLIKECNKRTNANLILIKDIALYIKRILVIFGTEFSELSLDKSYSSQTKATVETGGGESSNAAQNSLKYLETLALFRSQVRSICKLGDAHNGYKQILDLCDTLRDQILPNLGVRLEDRNVDGNPYVVKLVDPETVAKEKAFAEKVEQAQRLKEETTKLDKLSLLKQYEDKAKIPPSEMFKSQTDKYSQFDETGMPTHDATGKELSKSALKKLERLHNEQKSRYKKFLDKRKSDCR